MSIYYYLLPGVEIENVNVPIHEWTLVNVIYSMFTPLLQILKVT